MKKVLSIVLVLVMVLGLGVAFTGCGGEKESDAMKVGFIYIGSSKDGGFSEAQDKGREKMVEHFGGKVETEIIEEVPDNDAQATKDAALSLMDKGCKVIVGTSFGYMDTMEELSKEYPDNYFLHFSGNKANDTNFDNYFGAMEEPRYLAGVVAGMMTKSNTIGYVGAFDLPEVNIGINAFTLGAQSVNPNVEVKVVYLNTWYDPAKER
ncbi:MAG: BMP family ABC transporter substrate-binding protein, partial [Anaerovoracaceae bacterium]